MIWQTKWWYVNISWWMWMWSFFKQPTVILPEHYSPAPSQLGLISQRWCVCVCVQVNHLLWTKLFWMSLFYTGFIWIFFGLNWWSVASWWTEWLPLQAWHWRYSALYNYSGGIREWMIWYLCLKWNCRNILTFPCQFDMKLQKYFNHFPAKEFNCAADTVLFKKGVSPWVGQIGSIHFLELGLSRACMRSQKLSWTASGVFLADGKHFLKLWESCDAMRARKGLTCNSNTIITCLTDRR